MNEAWNRDDWATLEALCGPDVEAVAPRGWPEAGEFKGWPAVRRQFERLKESLVDEHAELLSAESVGPGTVLTGYRWTGRGEGSGLDLDMQVWRIDEIEGGRITCTVFFLDRAEARRAAGLP